MSALLSPMLWPDQHPAAGVSTSSVMLANQLIIDMHRQLVVHTDSAYAFQVNA